MRRRVRERDSKVNGEAGVYGLITNPVEYSMSPLMHNFYARRTGMNLAYVSFEVEDKQVRDAVEDAFVLNILGMSVAVPHKQRVMEFLTSIDRGAKTVGTINTLMRTGHGYKGYGMGAASLTRALLGAGIHVGGERCILIGTGSAAKAVIYVLAREGAASICIMDHNLDRTQELAEYINRLVGRNPASTLPLDGCESTPQEKDRYLAIQSTSVGMHSHVENVIVEDRCFYELIHTGVNIIHTPVKTRFMGLVEGADGKVVNELNMLLYQGIIAYELQSPQARVDEETISMTRQLIQDHLSMSQAKHNLILVGFMGAGKASMGDCYARGYGLPIIDTDQRIKVAASVAVSKVFATQGERAFRRPETGMLEELLARADHSIISVRGGLPLREEGRILLRKLDCVVYLDVSPETVVDRVGRDVFDRPMLQDGDMESKIRGLLAMHRPVYLETSHMIVGVNGRSVGEIVEGIRCRAGV